jgi:hypothetical protein
MKPSRRSYTLVLGSFAVFMALSALNESATAPTWWAPLPIQAFFEATLGWPRWLTFPALPALGAASCLLILHRDDFAKPFAAIMVGLTLGGLAYLGLNVVNALPRYGVFHVLAVCVENALLLLCYWLLLRRWWRQRSERAAFWTVFVAFSWLCWCAFPYLFEAV